MDDGNKPESLIKNSQTSLKILMKKCHCWVLANSWGFWITGVLCKSYVYRAWKQRYSNIASNISAKNSMSIRVKSVIRKIFRHVTILRIVILHFETFSKTRQHFECILRPFNAGDGWQLSDYALLITVRLFGIFMKALCHWYSNESTSQIYIELSYQARFSC